VRVGLLRGALSPCTWEPSRTWWSVCDDTGRVCMSGHCATRDEARATCEGALDVLTAAPAPVTHDARS
jgi:hypothetical protein